MGTFKVLLMLISLLWLLPGYATAMVNAPTQVSDLAPCAMQCWAQSTASSSCASLDNTTCICNMPSFDSSLMACLNDNCPLIAVYGALRVSHSICDLPVRSRKDVIWAILPLHIFAMICVITRLYAKAFVFRRFWTDDWIILVAALLYFGWFCVQHHLFEMAFGQDIWWADPDELTTAMLLLYLSTPIYLVLLCLAKASLLCFYLRLFPHERFRKLCYAVLALVVAITISWTFLAIFECTPVPYHWLGWTGVVPGSCLDTCMIMEIISSVNLGLDTVIIIMPIPLVLTMRSTLRRKFAIIVMFSLGTLVVVASAIRLQYIVRYGRSKNFTYDFVDMILWTGIEIAASIIVTSLPTIRLLLHRRFPGALSRVFAFGAHATGDREYLEKYPTAAKAVLPSIRSHRFIPFHRHQTPPPSIPLTIGGHQQDETSPKRQLEVRKARHMAAMRRGAGEASRVLASILGTVTETFHRSVSRSVLASGDRDKENRMGMGIAPDAFTEQLVERLNSISSTSVNFGQEMEKHPAAK